MGALLTAACAGGGEHAATPVATTSVDMPRSYRYAPTAITVPAGTTVTWTNSDQFTHSVQLLETEIDLVVRPGDTASHTFTDPGTYEYTCTFHPNDMSGSVLVTEQ